MIRLEKDAINRFEPLHENSYAGLKAFDDYMLSKTKFYLRNIIIAIFLHDIFINYWIIIYFPYLGKAVYKILFIMLLGVGLVIAFIIDVIRWISYIIRYLFGP